MRYLHQEAEQICAYVRSRGLTVKKYDNTSPSSSSAIDVSIVEEVLKTSETLWGGSLPYYLRISKVDAGDLVTLKEGVSKVEASSSHDEFILVAYPDGGLISVSGVVLPFRKGAPSANWWGLDGRSWRD